MHRDGWRGRAAQWAVEDVISRHGIDLTNALLENCIVAGKRESLTSSDSLVVLAGPFIEQPFAIVAHAIARCLCIMPSTVPMGSASIVVPSRPVIVSAINREL